MTLNVLSLFSGIGGLELGLERAGMTVVGQVELDPFRRSVLAKHWPEVPKHDDVRTTVPWWLGTARPVVDLVSSGFPCEPFSAAGLRAGVEDPRYGWPWTRDVIDAVHPPAILLENSPELLRNDHGRVWGAILSDLARRGFRVEWSVVSACSVGAPHPRRRLFAVAYAPGRRLEQCGGLQLAAGSDQAGHVHHWATQPEPHRVADGVPGRVDRNRALGLAVVPQVAEYIGRLIVAADRSEVAA